MGSGANHGAGTAAVVMDLTLSADELAFRDEFRAWIADHHPGAPPSNVEERYYWRLEWLRELNRGGFAAMHWPIECGGRGASAMLNALFFTELARAGAPIPANHIATFMAGPTIMQWGTEQQKERYLAPMLTAENVWCQGFSEPGAGSDLAAVATFAARDGDAFVVNGQKVWTSEAQYAHFCLLVARTDRSVAQHKGLTYFILDMSSQGITRRPLRQLTGESEFNELFFDNVRIPASSVIGEVGNGWRVAMTTLMHERSMIGAGYGIRLRNYLTVVETHLRSRGLFEDEMVSDRFADLEIRTRALELSALSQISHAEARGSVGSEGSILKLMWSDTYSRLAEFAIETVGPDALEDGSGWAWEYLRSRASTIEGGTSDILRNIVADRVLGLPRAR